MIVVEREKEIEEIDGVGEIEKIERRKGEELRKEERMRKEELDIEGEGKGEIVLLRKLVNEKDRDDVMKGIVKLKDRMKMKGEGIVLLKEEIRVENKRSGVERVKRRVDKILRDRERKKGSWVKVGERGWRWRVGKVVGRKVNGMKRGDRKIGSSGDELMNGENVGWKSRMIKKRGRNKEEKRRKLRKWMSEEEDVVKEEKKVMEMVKEVLRKSKKGKGKEGEGKRGLVNMEVKEGWIGELEEEEIVKERIDNLVVKVVEIKGKIKEEWEKGIKEVRIGEVVDELNDEKGIEEEWKEEEEDIEEIGVRRKKVEEIDESEKNLGLGRMLDILRRVMVDGEGWIGIDGEWLVKRIEDEVNDEEKSLEEERKNDRLESVEWLMKEKEKLGRVNGDGEKGVLEEVMGKLEKKKMEMIVKLKRVKDKRKMELREIEVEEREDEMSNVEDRKGWWWIGGERISRRGIGWWGGIGRRIFGGWIRRWIWLGRGGSFRGRWFWNR